MTLKTKFSIKLSSRRIKIYYEIFHLNLSSNCPLQWHHTYFIETRAEMEIIRVFFPECWELLCKHFCDGKNNWKTEKLHKNKFRASVCEPIQCRNTTELFSKPAPTNIVLRPIVLAITFNNNSNNNISNRNGVRFTLFTSSSSLLLFFLSSLVRRVLHRNCWNREVHRRKGTLIHSHTHCAHSCTPTTRIHTHASYEESEMIQSGPNSIHKTHNAFANVALHATSVTVHRWRVRENYVHTTSTCVASLLFNNRLAYVLSNRTHWTVYSYTYGLRCSGYCCWRCWWAFLITSDINSCKSFEEWDRKIYANIIRMDFSIKHFLTALICFVYSCILSAVDHFPWSQS